MNYVYGHRGDNVKTTIFHIDNGRGLPLCGFYLAGIEWRKTNKPAFVVCPDCETLKKPGMTKEKIKILQVNLFDGVDLGKNIEAVSGCPRG